MRPGCLCRISHASANERRNHGLAAPPPPGEGEAVDAGGVGTVELPLPVGPVAPVVPPVDGVDGGSRGRTVCVRAAIEKYPPAAINATSWAEAGILSASSPG